MTQIELYRSRHVIEPRVAFRYGRRVWICATDGIRVVMRANGWRHEPGDVKAAAREGR
jgi:hypothetical protein